MAHLIYGHQNNCLSIHSRKFCVATIKWTIRWFNCTVIALSAIAAFIDIWIYSSCDFRIKFLLWIPSKFAFPKSSFLSRLQRCRFIYSNSKIYRNVTVSNTVPDECVWYFRFQLWFIQGIELFCTDLFHSIGAYLTSLRTNMVSIRMVDPKICRVWFNDYSIEWISAIFVAITFLLADCSRLILPSTCS